MEDQNRAINRRELLKLMGATGATAAFASAGGVPGGGPATVRTWTT